MSIGGPHEVLPPHGSTHSSCSLSVRMKRSAQPFPSGAVTNDGLERMPRRWSCCLVEPDYRLG